jgi:hypothetical protein
MHDIRFNLRHDSKDDNSSKVKNKISKSSNSSSFSTPVVST